MEILHQEGTDGFFHIDGDGEHLAELRYSRSQGDRINIYHTEVGDKLAGHGIGKKLVAEAVKYAREKGLTVTATCPYARKVLDTTPEYQDVIAPAV